MEPMPTNVACQHALFYAQKEGQLTDDSMTEGHTVQNIQDGVYVKKWAINNMLCDRGLEKSAKCLATINNPASSGIWDENGFNEKRFSEVTQNCVLNSDGKLVMTETIFKRFLENLHAGESLGNATHLGYLVPLPWSAVTGGSVGELFRYYSDTTLVNENGQSENAMTIEKFRKFYTNPNSVAQERVDSLKTKEKISSLEKV